MTNSAFPIPTFLNTPTAINVRTFTSSTTYTPSPNTRLAVIECIGGGGGGGGTASAAGSTYAAGAGGGGGSYSRKMATIATIGASQTVTIGAAGTGGAAGNNAGGNGGTTSVGSLCTAPGGSGGGGNSGASGITVSGGVGGIAGTGDFSTPGSTGIGNYNSTTTSQVLISAAGGASGLGFGFGGEGSGTVTATNGNAGKLYGGGGSGGASFNGNGMGAGGAGAPGVVIITEYIDTQSNGISAPVLTLLSSKTFSGASTVEFLIADGLDVSQYTDFYLRFFVKGTADYTLAMQVGTGSPVDYTAAVNRYVNSCADETGTVLTGNSLVASVNLTSGTRTVSGTFAGDGLTGDLNIYNAANGPTPGIPWIQFQGNFVFYSSVTGKFQTNSFANMGGGANSLTGLKFGPNTGTISGRITLYGKKI